MDAAFVSELYARFIDERDSLKVVDAVVLE